MSGAGVRSITQGQPFRFDALQHGSHFAHEFSLRKLARIGCQLRWTNLRLQFFQCRKRALQMGGIRLRVEHAPERRHRLQRSAARLSARQRSRKARERE